MLQVYKQVHSDHLCVSWGIILLLFVTKTYSLTYHLVCFHLIYSIFRETIINYVQPCWLLIQSYLFFGKVILWRCFFADFAWWWLCNVLNNYARIMVIIHISHVINCNSDEHARRNIIVLFHFPLICEVIQSTKA